jgi:hypothetical protein
MEIICKKRMTCKKKQGDFNFVLESKEGDISRYWQCGKRFFLSYLAILASCFKIVTLEIVDSSKYLGVTLTSNLSWDKHVDNVAAKGNRTLGFIRRNLKDCTRTVKETSYIAISDCSLEEGIPVCFVVGSFLEKAMLASCPAIAMPNI